MNDRTLAQALKCLEPLRSKLVIVGGAAHRLFPLHRHGRNPEFELLTTEDIDLAAPLELRHDGSRDLLDRLEAAGFSEQIKGAEWATHTYHPTGNSTSYLQFIAPLTGTGSLRSGERDRLMKFSGIHAEKLRHVDILLHRPWTVTLSVEELDLSLQVVNPIAFLIQKLLVLPTRGAKRGKDLLYIFDTLTIFASNLETLAAETPRLAPSISKKTATRILHVARETCFRETDVSREAAVIAQEQRSTAPDSPQIVGACELGLRKILGGLVAGT